MFLRLFSLVLISFFVSCASVPQDLSRSEHGHREIFGPRQK